MDIEGDTDAARETERNGEGREGVTVEFFLFFGVSVVVVDPIDLLVLVSVCLKRVNTDLSRTFRFSLTPSFDTPVLGTLCIEPNSTPISLDRNFFLPRDYPFC